MKTVSLDEFMAMPEGTIFFVVIPNAGLSGLLRVKGPTLYGETSPRPTGFYQTALGPTRQLGGGWEWTALATAWQGMGDPETRIIVYDDTELLNLACVLRPTFEGLWRRRGIDLWKEPTQPLPKTANLGPEPPAPFLG